MNILIATGLYPPEIGGPATYAAMLEQELPKHGMTVSVVPFGWVRQYPKIVRHVVFAWKVWQESKQADVIYALDPISVGIPTLLVARLRRVPFLIRLGGDYAWEQGRIRFGISDTLDVFLDAPTKRPLPVRALAWLQSYVTKRARQVIVPSAYLKTVVERWGVNTDSITVIYSALYPLTVSGTREELRQQLSYSSPTIVSAARLVPWKGFMVLIEVVATLKERYPDITLIIVGDGEERRALEIQVAKFKLQSHVRFAGRVSKDALGAVIRAADVFVLNTAYEGLSHQLIEVMDLGVPIVTTTAGGNPELITDNINGLLVPFNDAVAIEEAIVRILEHPEMQQRMVQTARGRSKEFAQEVVVAQIAAVLSSIHD